MRVSLHCTHEHLKGLQSSVVLKELTYVNLGNFVPFSISYCTGVTLVQAWTWKSFCWTSKWISDHIIILMKITMIVLLVLKESASRLTVFRTRREAGWVTDGSNTRQHWRIWQNKENLPTVGLLYEQMSMRHEEGPWLQGQSCDSQRRETQWGHVVDRCGTTRCGKWHQPHKARQRTSYASDAYVWDVS